MSLILLKLILIHVSSLIVPNFLIFIDLIQYFIGTLSYTCYILWLCFDWFTFKKGYQFLFQFISSFISSYKKKGKLINSLSLEENLIINNQEEINNNNNNGDNNISESENENEGNKIQVLEFDSFN
jgi:hypothetical protein